MSEYLTEDEAAEEAMPEEALSNPKWTRMPSRWELQARADEDRACADEDRYLAERYAQDQACPSYEAECIVCSVLVSTSVDPARHDVTCRSCEQGWRP